MTTNDRPSRDLYGSWELETATALSVSVMNPDVSVIAPSPPPLFVLPVIVTRVRLKKLFV